MRLAVIGGLYAVAMLGVVGGYGAAVVLTASAVHQAWGLDAAIAAIGLCLVVTAIFALVAARIVRRRLNHSGVPDHERQRNFRSPTPNGAMSDDDDPDESDSQNSDTPPSLTRVVAELLAEKVPVEAWVGVASFLAAACVAVGPVRLIRIGLHVALRATEPPPQDKAPACRRTGGSEH